MSLLEDVFLEDEAGEAQELERIIEGDEFEERARSRSPDSDSNSEKEDEAEEDRRRVDPSQAKAKRVIKNPRFILNPARLTGPRGIQVLPEHFKDFKFKGKGHEKDDLDILLKKLEHWAYRLYPKFQFEDCLKKIETLGKKRPVMVHLHKIRTDQFASEDSVVQKDSSDDEAQREASPPRDEFDILLQQQIDLARATPASNKGLDTPSVDRSLMMPKATSSPSINEEQRERMLRNRRLAEERRLAKLKENSSRNNVEITIDNESVSDNSAMNGNEDKRYDNGSDNKDMIENDNIVFKKKLNKSNVIDSSDDENDISAVEESTTVDIHDNSREISRNKHNDVSTTEKDITESDVNIVNDVPEDKESDTIRVLSRHNVNDNNEIDKEITTDNDVDIINVNSENIRQDNDKTHKEPDIAEIECYESFENVDSNQDMPEEESGNLKSTHEVNKIDNSNTISKENEIDNGKNQIDTEVEKEKTMLEIMDVDFTDDF